MSDFTDGTDWELAVQRLRLSCVGQCLDLQMVWLFEILAILLFQANKGSKYVVRLSKSWRLTHRDMPKLVPAVGISQSLVNRLIAYRNTFCHFGFLDAKPLLQEFLATAPPEELDRLQRYTGVTLNLRNQLSL